MSENKTTNDRLVAGATASKMKGIKIMASIYDNIRTAKELVDIVGVQGLSTKVEDICRAQDIFGRAAIEELVELANDTGRNNENGEPDKNGSWSSNRKATRPIFYQILFQIWHWEDATRFYNQHSNPEYEELKTLRTENKKLSGRVENLEAKRDELLANAKDASDVILEEMNKKAASIERAEKAEKEIVKLKAKLYDLMIAKEENLND